MAILVVIFVGEREIWFNLQKILRELVDSLYQGHKIISHLLSVDQEDILNS